MYGGQPRLVQNIVLTLECGRGNMRKSPISLPILQLEIKQFNRGPTGPATEIIINR